jgi:hypothetical protein
MTMLLCSENPALQLNYASVAKCRQKTASGSLFRASADTFNRRPPKCNYPTVTETVDIWREFSFLSECDEQSF